MKILCDCLNFCRYELSLAKEIRVPKDIDNSSALKHLFNQSLLKRISSSIANVHPSFEYFEFQKLTLQMNSLEMKPRVLFIRDQLHQRLPQNYPQALQILLNSTQSNQLSGFDLWPYMEYVQTFGLEHFDISLNALKKMTPLFTAEWAIRPFIKTDPKKTLAFLLKCSKDKNEHIRRWASEGTRPRLPWGERLHIFIKDPTPLFLILENLKFDDSLYVRKSVSNHLNDIAKDHPDMVIKILKKWKSEAQGENLKKIDWIIQRSLRTLIKEGHPKALGLIGVSSEVKIKLSKLALKKNKIKLGERVEFSFRLASSSAKPQKLVIDYVIHFMKANNKTSAKVFKLKTFEILSKEDLLISKSHHIKKITTREYYPGRHLLEVQVNGKIVGKIPWDLKVDY